MRKQFKIVEKTQVKFGEEVNFYLLKRKWFLFIPYWSKKYTEDGEPLYTKTREQAEQIIELWQ